MYWDSDDLLYQSGLDYTSPNWCVCFGSGDEFGIGDEPSGEEEREDMVNVSSNGRGGHSGGGNRSGLQDTLRDVFMSRRSMLLRRLYSHQEKAMDRGDDELVGLLAGCIAMLNKRAFVWYKSRDFAAMGVIISMLDSGADYMAVETAIYRLVSRSGE